jgi:phosphate-selective porin OprO and OprP
MKQKLDSFFKEFAMKTKHIAVFASAILAIYAPPDAHALDLYVDTNTQQIFAQPGEGRVKLGTFVQVEDAEKSKVEIAELKEELEKKKNKEETKKGHIPAGVSYGKDGFEFRTENDKFSLAIQNRIQFRYAEPFDSDPRTLADLERDENSLMIRRARTKMRGHAYVPWLKYYLQYDWSQPILRDLSLTIDKYKWAEVRVGRGKVTYNNERVTSSGAQQFVNRSIVNDIFTVDRQQGIEVKGNLFADTWYDMTYYAGVYTGLGVGERNNDDGNMMYSGRLQWNALGGEMKFSQSDVEFHEKPQLNISIAANTNQSRCTAFETDSRSCRRITDVNANGTARYRDPSAAGAVPGQYEIDQMMEEIHYKWRGFSFLHELHAKKILDKVNDQETELRGGFVQAGYFPHGMIRFIPKNIEIAGRWAFVDLDTDRDNDKQKEISAVLNYFVEGHNNKFSLQVSRLTVEDPIVLKEESEERLWAQWDLSF